mmetsp:Transcript_92961/g.240153  ORF Transcript_92961/g.240153 Transcript_92961/m.240153 type:complete len:857 (+) Transcript_92961:133-2703(+)
MHVWWIAVLAHLPACAAWNVKFHVGETESADFGRFHWPVVHPEHRAWSQAHLSPVVEPGSLLWPTHADCPEECIDIASWSCSLGAGHFNATARYWPQVCGTCGNGAVLGATFRSAGRTGRARKLAGLVRAAASRGLVCQDLELDLSGCPGVHMVAKERRSSRAASHVYWPFALAKELAFWAAFVSSSATTVSLIDESQLLHGANVLTTGEVTGKLRFNRRYLTAVRRTDLHVLQRSTLEWATPFEVVLAPELGKNEARPHAEDDQTVYLRYMLQELRHEDYPVPEDWNRTRTRLADPRHTLAEQAAVVARTIQVRYQRQLIVGKQGLVIGRDSTSRFFAESCPLVFDCQCAFLDASSLRPNDMSHLYDTPTTVLNKVQPQFVIILPLGAAQAPWTTALNSHPYGDFMQLWLITNLLVHEAWVLQVFLAHDHDQMLVDVNSQGEHRLVPMVGMVDCARKGGTPLEGVRSCSMDTRSTLRVQGFELGPMVWVRGALRGGPKGGGTNAAFAHWGCGGCGRVAGAGLVRPVISTLKRIRTSGVSWLRLIDTAAPLTLQESNVLLSFPGSGQTLMRLMMEAVSGRPTLNLYEMTMNWGRVPLCVCFEGTGILRDVACAAPPVMGTHHNSLYVRTVDEASMRSLLVQVRDYKLQLGKRFARAEGPVDFEEIQRYVNDFAYAYFAIVYEYERFAGRKAIVYFEELIADPVSAVERVVEELELPGIPASSIAMLRGQAVQLQSQVADFCADLPYTPLPGCGSACKNFMKSHKRGPWHPTEPKIQSWHRQIGEAVPTPDDAAKNIDPRWAAEATRAAVDEFEALFCPGRRDFGGSFEVIPKLATKYLQRPGWGSAKKGERPVFKC